MKGEPDLVTATYHYHPVTPWSPHCNQQAPFRWSHSDSRKAGSEADPESEKTILVFLAHHLRSHQ